MHRLRLATFLVLLLALSFNLSAQFDRGWEYVVPGANFVAGIDWQQVSGSEFGQALKQQFGGGKVTSSGNLDFVERFDWALISATDSGGRGRRPANAVVYVSGRFDLARLRKVALTDGGRRQEYAGLEMFSKPGSGGPAIAVLDDTTLLLGDEVPLKAAIRSRSVDRPLSPIAAAAKADHGAAGVWLIANGPAGATRASGPFDGVSGVALVIRFAQNADLVLSMSAPNEKRAASLAAGLGLVVGMLPPGTAPPRVQASGSTVRMELSITPEQVKAGARQFATALSQQAGVPDALKAMIGDVSGKPAQEATSVQRPTPSPQTVPPEKQVIRIHGMEGGVREIPVEQIK